MPQPNSPPDSPIHPMYVSTPSTHVATAVNASTAILQDSPIADATAPAKAPATSPPRQRDPDLWFTDGDVMVISPTGFRWKLQTQCLCRASGTIRDILDTVNPARLKKIETTDGKAVPFKLLMFLEERARNVDPNGVKYKAFVAIVCRPFL